MLSSKSRLLVVIPLMSEEFSSTLGRLGVTKMWSNSLTILVICSVSSKHLLETDKASSGSWTGSSTNLELVNCLLELGALGVDVSSSNEIIGSTEADYLLIIHSSQHPVVTRNKVTELAIIAIEP